MDTRLWAIGSAGPIVSLLAHSLESVAIGGDFGVLGSALYSMGIPGSSIKQYEQAIQDDQFLLIVHGKCSEVECACTILHGETQQVTVHRA